MLQDKFLQHIASQEELLTQSQQQVAEALLQIEKLQNQKQLLAERSSASIAGLTTQVLACVEMRLICNVFIRRREQCWY